MRWRKADRLSTRRERHPRSKIPFSISAIFNRLYA
jgi:hypothetical protein